MALHRFFPALALASALAAAGVPARGDECAACHKSTTPKISSLFEHDVHRAALGCAGCHGGDASAKTKEGGHDPTKGYRGKLDPTQVPKLCGECHADAARMKEHRLDPRVLAEWGTSPHGKLFAQGDARGASCTTCHGSHGIGSHEDPEAPTHRAKVPGTCGSCHSDPERMAPSKLRTDQEKEYLAGVHGRILMGLRPGDRDVVPTCTDCHGHHGAKPPNAVSVPAVCGHCHYEESMHLKRSAHYGALIHTGTPSCVTCHGNHHNTLPEGGLIAKSCASCHDSELDPGTKVAAAMAELFNRAHHASAQLAGLLERADPADATKQRLLAAEKGHVEKLASQLRKRSHALDLDQLRASVVHIEDSVKAAFAVASTDLDGGNGFDRTTVILVFVGLGGALLLLSAWLVSLLAKLRRRFHSEGGMTGERSL